MADILNLQVKDETINNIISNNPYYIDIKGSVNICLIRCGQDIEKCNSIEFSTMTNYGKVLVLNPNPSKIGLCNIKLAFDTSNDNINNSGDSNYKFEKAFVTVPSLHKLNGQIYDMETFLIFSSIQKNGDILYVCLCTFSTGTNIVQNNDWKLLNFKLMNELFSKNNTVPEMYGTSDISGVPNPVDLSNFIPKEGSRNFYDYTHPLNTKVNFRVYQTPLSVSNEVLDILKTKLTPGNMYQNFRSALAKTLNPNEGLYFYFSEDLTDRYKSFEVNQNNENNTSQKDTFENIGESILEEQITFEKESKFKKMDIVNNSSNQELDNFNENKIDDSEKNKEEFVDDTGNNNNMSIVLTIFIICFLLFVNIGYLYFINNIFTPSDELTEENLKDCLHEIASISMSNTIKWKFNFYNTVIFHCIFTFILIVLLVSFLSSGVTNASIYSGIGIFIAMIFIVAVLNVVFFHLYFYNRLKNIMDDNFSQKENYFIKYIRDKVLESKNIGEYFSNYIRLSFSNDYTPFIGLKGMTGGYEMVPGLNNNDEENLRKEAENKKKIEGISGVTKFFSSEILGIIKGKILENKVWIKNILLFIVFLIVIFILGIVFQTRLVAVSGNTPIKGGFIYIIFVLCQLPYILSLIYEAFILLSGQAFNIMSKGTLVILGILGLTSIILSIFIPFYNDTYFDINSWKNNVPLWLFIVIILLMSLIPGIIYAYKYFFSSGSISKYIGSAGVPIGALASASSSTSSSTSSSVPPGIPPGAPHGAPHGAPPGILPSAPPYNINKLSQNYETYRDKYQNSEQKRILLQAELNGIRTSGIVSGVPPSSSPGASSSSSSGVSTANIKEITNAIGRLETKISGLTSIPSSASPSIPSSAPSSASPSIPSAVPSTNLPEATKKIIADLTLKLESTENIIKDLTAKIGSKNGKSANLSTMSSSEINRLTENLLDLSQKLEIEKIITTKLHENIIILSNMINKDYPYEDIYKKLKDIGLSTSNSSIQNILKKIDELYNIKNNNELRYKNKVNILMEELEKQKDYEIQLLSEIDRLYAQAPIIGMTEKLAEKDAEIEELKKQLQDRDNNKERLSSIIDESEEKQILLRDTLDNYEDTIQDIIKKFATETDSLYEKMLALKDDSSRKDEYIRYLSENFEDSINKINMLSKAFTKFKLYNSAKYLINIGKILLNIQEASKDIDKRRYLSEIKELVDKTKDENIEEIKEVFDNEISQLYKKIEEIGTSHNNKDIYSYLYDALLTIGEKARIIAEELQKPEFINVQFNFTRNHVHEINVSSPLSVVGNNERSRKTNNDRNRKIAMLEQRLNELSDHNNLYDKYIRLKALVEENIKKYINGTRNINSLNEIKTRLDELNPLQNTVLYNEIVKLKSIVEKMKNGEKLNINTIDLDNPILTEYIRLHKLLQECITKSTQGKYNQTEVEYVKAQLENAVSNEQNQNMRQEIIKLHETIQLLTETKIDTNTQIKLRNNEIAKLKKEKEELIQSQNLETIQPLRDQIESLESKIRELTSIKSSDNLASLEKNKKIKQLEEKLQELSKDKELYTEYLKLKASLEESIIKYKEGTLDISSLNTIKVPLNQLQPPPNSELNTEIVKLKDIIEQMKKDKTLNANITNLENPILTEYIRLHELLEDCITKSKQGKYNESEIEYVKTQLENAVSNKQNQNMREEIIKLHETIQLLTETKIDTNTQIKFRNNEIAKLKKEKDDLLQSQNAMTIQKLKDEIEILQSRIGESSNV